MLPGAEVVDAGCGTGRYAMELARRGYRVDGIDVSPELVDVAKRAAAESHGPVSFGSATSWTCRTNAIGRILCRGVLNDILDEVSAMRCLRRSPGRSPRRRAHCGRARLGRVSRAQKPRAALPKAGVDRSRRADLHRCDGARSGSVVQLLILNRMPWSQTAWTRERLSVRDALLGAERNSR